MLYTADLLLSVIWKKKTNKPTNISEPWSNHDRNVHSFLMGCVAARHPRLFPFSSMELLLIRSSKLSGMNLSLRAQCCSALLPLGWCQSCYMGRTGSTWGCAQHGNNPSLTQVSFLLMCSLSQPAFGQLAERCENLCRTTEGFTEGIFKS